MRLFDENNLTRWVVIIPIISVVITAIVFLSTGISKRIMDLKEETRIKQINLLKNYKQDAMRKVNTVIDFLQNTEELQKEEAKEDVKNMVEIASGIIDNIYKKNQDLTYQQIVEKIKIRLRDIRFWDGSGYYFIYNTDGKCILLPTNQSLENINLISLQDIKGKFMIKEHTRIAKEDSEGFDEWYWHKPNENIMKKKIGFVKAYKPLDIYIGTARYEEDVINKIKDKMVTYLDKKNENNFFLYDGFGNSIIKRHASTSKENLQDIIKGSKVIPEGFFINHTVSTYFNIMNEVKKGTLFVRYIPEFDWIVGSDIYNEIALKSLMDEKEKLKNLYITLLKNRLFFALIILIVVLVVTVYFANKLKKVLKKYQQSLIKEHEVTLKQEKKLAYNLKHDYLTALPNRLLLTDRLDQCIKHSLRNGQQIAVVFIDIDKFKSINDSLGHNAGDKLLKEIAKRLKNSIRDSDTVARFGGDEFVMLVDNFKNIHDLITVIGKVQESLFDPVIIGKNTHNITLSMGASIFPNDGNSVELLLKNADIAMYKSKKEGGDRYRFFTQAMNEETQKQIEIEKQLHVAVRKNEFVLYYQPLVESNSGKIVGVEALIRWNHPIKGLIFPDEFIDIAEENSVIIEMGRWIVHEALSQMSEWKTKGYGLEKMSINIAVKQLEHNGFLSCMKHMIEETSCKAEWIELEIIERFAMKNIKKSIEILNEIRAMNIDVAIDDFGTGHSSLAYLKQLPITKLKIDRAFVMNIENSYEDRAIAESILSLGSGLRLKVLAEGIENTKQRDFFKKFNCDEMQGYLFSKPLAVDQIEVLLKKGYIG